MWSIRPRSHIGVRRSGWVLPSMVTADLVFVRAGQALAGLQRLLDGPSPSGHTDQLAQRDRLGAVAAVERQFAGVAVTADQQRPTLRVQRVGGVAMRGAGVFDPRPVVVALALRTRPGREPLPGPAWQPGGQLVGADGVGRDVPVAADRERVLRYLDDAHAIDTDAQAWARQVADALRGAIHEVNTTRADDRDDPDADLITRLRRRYDQGVAVGISTNLSRPWPKGNHPGLQLARRLKRKAHQVWLFTTRLDVPATNNGSESAIRGFQTRRQGPRLLAHPGHPGIVAPRAPEGVDM